MAAPYHLIESKIEDALAAAIATVGTLTALTVYKGNQGEEITLPALLLYVETSEPEIVSGDVGPVGLGGTVTGNWLCSLMAVVVTSSDDKTRAQHEAYVAELRDILVGTANLHTLMNNESITDLTVHQWLPGECRRLVDEGQRRTEQDGTVYAQPS